MVGIFCSLSPFSLWLHTGHLIFQCGTARKKWSIQQHSCYNFWHLAFLIANSTVYKSTNYTMRMVTASSATTLFPQATIGGRRSLVKGVSVKSSISGMVETRAEKLYVPSRHCSKQVDREDWKWRENRSMAYPTNACIHLVLISSLV